MRLALRWLHAWLGGAVPRAEPVCVQLRAPVLKEKAAGMGTLGGASLNVEDNYLIKKLFGGGLGVVSIENQARI